MLPAWYAAQPNTTAPARPVRITPAARLPAYCRAMASPRLYPEAMVMRAAASCNITQANVAYTSVHSKSIPYSVPAAAAVVTVPGPMKAAEMTDQNNALSKPVRNEMILAKGEMVIGHWSVVIG
jgi:hypothetical protein